MPRFGRSVSRAGWVVALLAGFATPRLAGAACSGLGPDFGQILPNCGGGYCYVVSPGQHTPETLAGSFWNFGAGNPTVGQGQDSGSWPVTSWLLPSGSSLYVSGGWQASPTIDGCISGSIAPGKPAEIMVAMISDDATTGGVFAVAAARRVIGTSPEFDFTFVAGGGAGHDIDLVDIPRARITGFTSPNVFVFTGPGLADVSPGIYSDGSVTAGELAKGYRVYTRPTGSTDHSRSNGWTAVTGVVPLGQNVSAVVPWQYEVHFAYTLVFDGGFETAHVGRVLTALSTPRCEVPPWDDDADGYVFWNDPSCAPDPSLIDCNDGNAAIHPGALELCNGVDDNCDTIIDNVALPGSVVSLTLARIPGAARLTWPPLAVAVDYDVVRGDLGELSISDGDFAAATDACLVDDVTATQVDDPDDPDPGYGFWYLLRAGNCTGVGSYDDVDPTQAAPRGAGIAASGQACP